MTATAAVCEVPGAVGAREPHTLVGTSHTAHTHTRTHTRTHGRAPQRTARNASAMTSSAAAISSATRSCVAADRR